MTDNNKDTQVLGRQGEDKGVSPGDVWKKVSQTGEGQYATFDNDKFLLKPDGSVEAINTGDLTPVRIKELKDRIKAIKSFATFWVAKSR